MMRRMTATAVVPLIPRAQSRATSCFTGNGDNRNGNKAGRNDVSKGPYGGRPYDDIVSSVDVDGERLRGSASCTLKKAQTGPSRSKYVLSDARGGVLRECGTKTEASNELGRENLREENKKEERMLSKIKKKCDVISQPKRKTFILTSNFSNRYAIENDNKNHSDNDEDVTRIYSYNEVEQAGNKCRPRQGDATFSKSSPSPTVGVNSVVKREMMRERRGKEKHCGDSAVLSDAGAVADRGPGWGNATSSENDKITEMQRYEGYVGKRSSGSIVKDADESHLKDNGYEEDDDEFAASSAVSVDKFRRVKNHPFFDDLLRRIEKNAARQRQQIRAAGHYNLDAVNLCVRPLLQLTDYPFTLAELHQMAPFIYPNLLKGSLSDLKACRRLHLFHSADTDVILDWSVEDFLRRRYESIHLSWEPVKIVMMRFGWDHEIMSDRDCLLYLSKFMEYIELAQLELSAGDEKPSAVAIEDPVRTAEQRPIPVSRLLVRRKPSEETEPSVTEAIRLMGTPALWSPSRSKKARTVDKESVEGVFECIQREAADVDGDEGSRLRHGVEVVAPLQQARNPSGRSIRDFSLGKRRATMINDDVPKSFGIAGGKPFDGDNHIYTPESYEALSNAYHKKKVEASLLRRRLLATSSIDCASELQEKLFQVQKDLSRLKDRLEKMRQLRRMEGGDVERHASVEIEGDDHGANARWMERKNCPIPKVAAAGVGVGDEISAGDEPVSVFTGEFEANQLNTSQQRGKNCNVAGDNFEEEGFTTLPVCVAEKGTKRVVQARLSDGREIQSLSSAAIQLKREIELAREKHRREEESLMKKMDEALSTLVKIEMTMKNLAEREKEEALMEEERCRLEKERKDEAIKRMRREEAEARARAMEHELLRKHEERLKLLNMRREKAQQAQRDAELELERQKKEEQEALEAEAELQRKLDEAKSMIWSDKAAGEMPVKDQVVHAVERECTPVFSGDADGEGCCRVASEEMKHESASLSSAEQGSPSELSCTPEQYDGLHLASKRLRKEIAELERQMDVEGDEDDMTLMAVLAVSRAELEELDEFIRMVQLKEPWATARDRARREEEMKEAKSRGDSPCDIQEKISDIRFQITLMEKRLQHATERRVITKLEQGIINGRREINRLRVEQDRLRRSGRPADAGGIQVPPFVSVAEALAEAEAEDIEASAVADDDLYREALEAPVGAHGSDNVASVGGMNRPQPGNVLDPLVAADHVTDSANDNSAECAESTPQEDERELQQLMVRLKAVLADIKQLEGRLDEQEDGDDAEAIAKSLIQLQGKLQQLLEMRETLRKRTERVSSRGKSDFRGPAFDESEEATTTPTPAVLTPLSGRPISGYALYKDVGAVRSGSEEFKQSGAAGGKKQQRVKSRKVRN
ncbi:uncharacterized protein TEOVI_000132600 [Trypanosoma equiperdum]|uniref:Uncharacterized protein n=1 Tax=Trypanosoma equiperdum TaxID=5694 RepID=A0A1G4IC83_TRYEQ|nr:hypothetical protein, conserved [Trypanosoma equiperdum]